MPTKKNTWWIRRFWFFRGFSAFPPTQCEFYGIFFFRVFSCFFPPKRDAPGNSQPSGGLDNAHHCPWRIIKGPQFLLGGWQFPGWIAKNKQGEGSCLKMGTLWQGMDGRSSPKSVAKCWVSFFSTMHQIWIAKFLLSYSLCENVRNAVVTRFLFVKFECQKVSHESLRPRKKSPWILSVLRGFDHLSVDQWKPWLVGIFFGDEILPSYIGIFLDYFHKLWLIRIPINQPGFLGSCHLNCGFWSLLFDYLWGGKSIHSWSNSFRSGLGAPKGLAGFAGP